jgi:hypothetical protein
MVGATFWEGGSMAQAVTQPTLITTTNPRAGLPAPNPERALQILSKTIYKELRENGYEPKQIVALATEIISLVTTDLGPLD